jgi:Fe-S cluster assembly ATP-binding protein
VTLIEYLRTIYNTHITLRDPHAKPVTSILFRRILTKLLTDFRLDISFLERDLYVGFSGGEKRRIELLQIRLLDPEYIILDEIDSGLDIDAIDILVTEIRSLREKGKCIIMITHNFDLLDEVSPDRAIILQDGAIQKSG